MSLRRVLAGTVLFGLPVVVNANLILNPGCELPLNGGQIPNWTNASGGWTRAYYSEIAPAEGSFYFFAGACLTGELYQDIPIPSSMWGETASFTGYVHGWTGQRDSSQIILEYRSATTLLDSFASAAYATPVWTLISDSRVVPDNTSFVRVRLLATKYDGPTDNDAYFDKLSLVVPEPTTGGVVALLGCVPLLSRRRGGAK